ncbi:MAG TPA: hypothetical protein DCS67_07155, partial [Clostridiales bacterium UBA8960]|nr:hypothetical protein [Clostridiales bacterium UBA8960]
AILKEALKEEIRSKTESQEYEQYFKEKVDEAIQELGASNTLVFGVHSKDAERLPKGVDVQIEDRLLGGFYVLKNGNEKYDMTLDSEVDALDAFLGCMLNTLYEITGEACDEER